MTTQKKPKYHVVNIKTEDFEALDRFCKERDLMLKDELGKAIASHVDQSVVVMSLVEFERLTAFCNESHCV